MIAVATALLAGCMATDPASSPSTPHTSRAAAVPAATVTLTLVEHDIQTPKVRLTNLLGHDLDVALAGFRLVDGNGTVTKPDSQTYMLQSAAFPGYVTLGPGESAQGSIVFVADPDAGPYTLKYSWIAGEGSVAFTQPPNTTKTMAANQTHVPGIGDWINGTYLNARLTSVTPIDAQHSKYEFDLVFQNSSIVAVISTDFTTLPADSNQTHVEFNDHVMAAGSVVRLEAQEGTRDSWHSPSPAEAATFEWAI